MMGKEERWTESLVLVEGVVEVEGEVVQELQWSNFSFALAK